MEEILLIVTATAGVLQIILFFKIWVMTNDVKSIKNKDYDLIKKSQLLSLKGDKSKADELLYDSFLSDVIDAYNESYSEADYFYMNAFEKIKNRYSEASKKFGFADIDFGRFDNKDKVASIFLTK